MPIHSPEFQKKKKQRFKFYLILTSSILIVLLVGVVYLARRPSFLISDIVVEGNHVTTTETVQELAKTQLQGKYFWLLPRSNAFLYPRKDIEESIKGNINRIKVVETKLFGSQVLNIRVEERSPFALYCEDISELYSPARCYFLDIDGFIFSVAPSFSGDVYFVYSRKEPILDPIGKYFMPTDEFASISLFRDELSKMSVKLRAFEVGVDEERFILPNSGYVVWQSQDGPAAALTNLQALLSDQSVKSVPDFMSKVEHIDLRLKNKIFYKLKGEEI
jgi:hypothetical protein